ncbi:MAG: glycosyltransferase family 9 protein [Endomicrobia bacterium]|nr:glycosyltransferase family 9 protein [Endomicrobiia bacterium]MCL2506401.1 glycosyltransferase family 9 protein [Endomicrobiia bacterium]
MKILIIKPSSFGDIVQALPSANALKLAYPDSEITWVVFKGWEDIISLCPEIDKTIIWDKKKGISGFFEVLKNVRKTEYDVIFDLQGLLRSALLAKLAKGKNKIGVSGMKELSNLLIKEVYPENAKINATVRNLKTINFFTKQDFPVDIKLKTESSSLINGNYIALVPFARGKGKDWNIENYIKLIDLINTKYQDFKIAVLGSKSDYGRIKSGKIIDLCGKTDIKQLASVLKGAKVSVGADTGPMHLSSALKTPSVFIFGKSDINETSPYIGKFSLLINKDNPADINKVMPEEVFAEAEKWIK